MRSCPLIALATALSLLAGIGCSTEDLPVAPVVWPEDRYQPERAMPDLDLVQYLVTVVATDAKPYEALKKQPPIAAYHLITRRDPLGNLFVEQTFMFNRDSAPIVVQFTDREGDKLKFHAGREGQVHSFRWTAGTNSIRTIRIPKDAKVRQASLVVLDQHEDPIRVDPKSESMFRARTIRWPKSGGITKFPLVFGLAFELDNEQTLVSVRVIDKIGRLAVADSDRRFLTAQLTPEAWKDLLESAAAVRTPTKASPVE